MKKILLLALLGSFAAQAMDDVPMAGPSAATGQIIVKSIDNKTDKDWVFVADMAGDTRINIPAQTTIQVNRALDYPKHPQLPAAQIQLNPMPNEDFAKFLIYTTKGKGISSSGMDKNGLWASQSYDFRTLKNPVINIQITQDKGEYSLSFKE